jgi:AMMECR1 domain-containing protein
MKNTAVILLLLSWGLTALAEDIAPEKTCRNTLNLLFQKAGANPYTTSQNVEKSRPLFVTLKKDGRTRGCAGTFQPQFLTLKEELAYFTVRAATEDFRYPPVTGDELEGIVIIITFPGELRPVSGLQDYNPWKHGLLVRKDGKEGVILPCEAKTSSYSAKKAAAQSGMDTLKGADIYIFNCETVTEKK